MAINGGIPGPTLRFTEGDDAVIHVHNHLGEETSLHWHGLLVPNDQDGVPHVNMPSIREGETRTYRFPIRQAGTYWYHSHSGIQEQLGVYGSIVIRPRGGERIGANKDVVAVLSDWTDEKPFDVLTQLRAGREWQQLKKGTGQNVLGAIQHEALGAYFKRSMMRMPAMDLSDIAYDRFLINGKPESFIPAKPGDRVRVRLINASAMTYYFIEFAGGPVEIISADGQDVRPLQQGRFLMAIAETYDVLVRVPAGGAFELRATAQDGTGKSSLFIGSGKRIPAPDVPHPNVYKGMAMGGGSMEGMDPSTMKMPMAADAAAMDMSAMDQSKMPGMKAEEAQPEAPADEMEGMEMPKKKEPEMEGMDHSKMPGMKVKGPGEMDGMKMPEKDMAGMDHTKMSSMTAGAGNAMDMTVEGRPGSPYESLRALHSTALSGGRPLREYTFRLQGDMIRYVWTLNGKTFTEADLVNIRRGERVQFHFINETMMHHPMHLHGHFFRVLTQAGNLSPLKHTVDVPPMTSRTIEFAADEPGDWMMHCHMLYHLEVGMARVIHYEDGPANPNLMVGPGHRGMGMSSMHDPVFFFGEVNALSNMTEGFAAFENNRNALTAVWQVGWGNVDETDYEVDLTYTRYLDTFTNVFAGAEITNSEAGNRGIVGVRYILPFLIRSQAWVDSEGDFRVGISQNIPLTPRLGIFGAADYDTASKWEASAGLEYILDKRFSLIGQWHSDFGWGAGLSFRF